jgi:hypothetical protein
MSLGAEVVFPLLMQMSQLSVTHVAVQTRRELEMTFSHFLHILEELCFEKNSKSQSHAGN